MAIKIDAVEGFHELSADDAKRTIYETLIPACEERGILLSDYGNHDITDPSKKEEYERAREAQTLFSSISRIQTIFKNLDTLFRFKRRYNCDHNSHALKYFVENKLYQKREIPEQYIYNGELIAAMILKGQSVLFLQKKDTNCYFKAFLIA